MKKLLLLLPLGVSSLVAKPATPIMGFSTWNCFKGSINESMLQVGRTHRSASTHPHLIFGLLTGAHSSMLAGRYRQHGCDGIGQIWIQLHEY